MENTIIFDVEGMTCGGCVRSVRSALETVPGVTTVRVVAGQPVEVRAADPAKAKAAIREAIHEAGFHPEFEDGFGHVAH